jgi:ribose 5-phosphate isomerase A
MRWSSTIANTLEWSGEIINRKEKEQVAARLATLLRDGDVVGFGSGSTSFLTIQAIGKRLKEESIRMTAIPTSLEVALACTTLSIPTTTLFQEKPDWSFDGADEVDPRNNLIKGRGGAMFKEKILIVNSPKTYIVVDKSKLVSRLGERFPVPIETYPSAVHFVEARLVALGATEVRLRLAKSKDGPVITEAGNFILDAKFKDIGDGLEREIKMITGVLESGLFQGYDVETMVAS